MKEKFNQNSIDLEVEALLTKYKAWSNDANQIENFADMPLSHKTMRGLSCCKFIQPTAIQRDSIGLALQGKDIVGCAITGSGKTLAFIIPVLERLFISKWSNLDGIGAIIISPTRELAYQIFETLKKIGQFHDFSVGLIIGGKNLKFEKKRMDRCNILICTPGRLLQHMDENPLFNAFNMQILVLDEADRCLDMGFEKSLNAILENLPTDRQTLLFSATQTESVIDLMRLNLKNAVYVGTKDLEKKVPDLLQQNYVVVDLDKKITMLWSFMKNHLKQKCIVFLASCKQVKYVYEIFCKLRPGTSLLALYGTLHQDRRLAIYNEFLNKKNVFLFATDIASRGLDFPSINWVIQLDCPENVEQYIHRAGRSARNKKHGESLLVLTPSEEHVMVDELKKNIININRIHIDPKKLYSPLAKMEAFLAQNPNLQASAKRAFLGYIKSVYNMKNKEIFDVRKINFDNFAQSLGLAITPRIRFLDKGKVVKNKEQGDITKSKENNLDISQFESEFNSEDLLTIKRTHTIERSEEDDLEHTHLMVRSKKRITKVALAKKHLKKRIKINYTQSNENSLLFPDLKDDSRPFSSNTTFNEYSEGEININASKHIFTKNKEKLNTKRKNTMDISFHVGQRNQTISSEKKHEEFYQTFKKQPKITAAEKVNHTQKRKKDSNSISLIDAEIIATEILC